MALHLPNIERINTNKLLIYAGIGLLCYVGLRAVFNGAEKVIDTATESAGNALSDLSSALNGWEPVELTPLQIRDFYLNGDYTLTDDARETLWNIDQYKPILIELFGNRYGALKAKYRSLINVSITKESLQ